MGKEKAERAKWDRPVESLFTQIGYLVGLGNLWRFPYLCQKNGGGVFLIPYAISLCLVSLPLYTFELGVGQFTNRGRLGCWNRLPLMKGVGYASFFITFLCMIPYMLIMAWGLLFLGHSFTTGPLPWTTCDNPWNTKSCITMEQASNRSKALLMGDNTTVNSNLTAYTKNSLPQVQFWRNYVLRIPNPENGIDGEFNWPVMLGLMGAFVSVFFVTFRGIKSSGKVVYFTATFPYVMLIALLIRGATLPGATEGIKAYLLPDLSQLAKPQVWIEAISQTVYSFGICFTAVTAFGSYNRYNHNFYRSSLWIVPCGAFSSLAMGFVTFSVLGHLSHVQGVNISEVIQSGPGLVFQVFPVGVSLMPAPQVWSIMFFIMIFFVAVDSSFSEFEGLMTIIGDAFPQLISTARRRAWSNTGLGITFFLLSLMQLHGYGIYIFELMNYYGASGICLLWAAFFESVAVGWLWDAKQFKRDVKEMTGSNLAVYYKYCYMFCIPLITSAVLMFYIIKWEPLRVGDFVYPTWANVIGWFLSLSSILCIPIVAVSVMWNGEGTLRERFQNGLKSKLKPRPVTSAEEKMMNDHDHEEVKM